MEFKGNNGLSDLTTSGRFGLAGKRRSPDTETITRNGITLHTVAFTVQSENLLVLLELRSNQPIVINDIDWSKSIKVTIENVD